MHMFMILTRLCGGMLGLWASWQTIADPDLIFGPGYDGPVYFFTVLLFMLGVIFLAWGWAKMMGDVP